MANFIPKIEYGTGPTTLTLALPPEDDSDELLEGVKRESVSISGVRQLSLDRTEITREIKLKFLTPSLKSGLETFFNSWGKYGKSFKFFQHSDEVTFTTYEMKDVKLKFDRDLPKNGDFLYSTKLTFRRYA